MKQNLVKEALKQRSLRLGQLLLNKIVRES